MVKTYGPRELWISFLSLIASLIMFIAPFIIKRIVNFIESDEPLWKGIFYAILLFTSRLVRVAFWNRYAQENIIFATQVKVLIQ